MKYRFPFICCFSAFLLLTIAFSSCRKNHDATPVQQGDSVIQINAIYIQNAYLQVRYNNVINSTINVSIRFYLKNGEQHSVTATIPAGYKELQYFGPASDDYLNVWNYSNGTDSTTGNTTTPVIGPNWDVDSIAITGVSSPDKRYGFDVLGGLDQWNYYHPTDAQTVVSFISNADTVSYSDYSFRASATSFNSSSSLYTFNFYTYQFLMVSATSRYPFQAGMTINIPILVYNWNGVNRGSQPDGPEAPSNGSTLQLTITRTDNQFYDATFSGKIWSSRQSDTLRISHGSITNALLPIRQ